MSYGIQKALKDVLVAIVLLGKCDSAVLANCASANNESASSSWGPSRGPCITALKRLQDTDADTDELWHLQKLHKVHFWGIGIVMQLRLSIFGYAVS